MCINREGRGTQGRERGGRERGVRLDVSTRVVYQTCIRVNGVEKPEAPSRWDQPPQELGGRWTIRDGRGGREGEGGERVGGRRGQLGLVGQVRGGDGGDCPGAGGV